MKKKLFYTPLITLLFLNFLTAQITKTTKMGQTSIEELKMSTYDKDPSSRAIVLFDQGNLYYYNNNLTESRTDYYFRVKILKKNGFDKATIKIPYYDEQEIRNIKGITYNLSNGSIQKTQLQENKIFNKKLSNNWKEVSFALPNVKVGSVIEYSYTLINPYELHLNDWYFQDDIPKVKSQYNSSIVGNFKYNIKLNGYFPLHVNNGSIKKRCVTYTGDGYTDLTVDCAVQEFAMIDMPAYIEEDYTTSKEDNISKLSFRLETIEYSTGKKNEYNTTWKATDRKLKSGVFFGSELKKSSFFKKNLPETIINETNQLAQAQQVFYFIQNHYTKNNKGYNFQKVNTKRAFDDKNGTIPEINMSLFNALKAVNIEAFPVLSSTRNNGKPTQLFPVITEFNYLMVKATINGRDYFLDASTKNIPFGIIPYFTLNGNVRVLDFKKGSYWQKVSPAIHTSTKMMMNIKVDENGLINNKLRVIKTGYDAYKSRTRMDNSNRDEYLKAFDQDNITLNNYQVKGDGFKDNQLVENYDYTIKNESPKSIAINLFSVDKFANNPFKLNSRFYPVDFGHTFSYNYRANVSIPDSYNITSFPESKAFSLPNNGGKLVLNSKKIGNKVMIIFQFQFNKAVFNNEEYNALKEFFNQIVKVHASTINIEKK